ncbi:hypothetical protein SBP8a_158 [Bacillus phage SBP8a]|nr:hypothetical protein SBP8a_158 [Bacillus phage SBP8a]
MDKVREIIDVSGEVEITDMYKANWGDLLELSATLEALTEMVDKEIKERMG